MTGAAQTPRQCAACVILNGAGQVLLVQQNYGARFWGVPGGVVDPGETAPQAAVREAAEEAGIAVELTGVIGLYELRGGGWPDVLAHVFSARSWAASRPRPSSTRTRSRSCAGATRRPCLSRWCPMSRRRWRTCAPDGPE